MSDNGKSLQGAVVLADPDMKGWLAKWTNYLKVCLPTTQMKLLADADRGRIREKKEKKSRIELGVEARTSRIELRKPTSVATKSRTEVRKPGSGARK